ncbi:26048_t:CDS:2 [Gigaspora margarita]|uniref:26048_t:CDS:1 n=1 Tax=Gigaspora margarita TaxID=4874 RepID=A0ABN7UKS6_GIGMA|nr:26048_t:CDS:2 [Gigaspora margarita]
MPEMVAIEIIKDFFAEIMAGGRGFGHPDYDGLQTVHISIRDVFGPDYFRKQLGSAYGSHLY